MGYDIYRIYSSLYETSLHTAFFEMSVLLPSFRIKHVSVWQRLNDVFESQDVCNISDANESVKQAFFLNKVAFKCRKQPQFSSLIYLFQ